MKAKPSRIVPLILMVVLLATLPLAGCAEEDEGKTTITIGMLTDLSGPLVSTGEIFHKTLKDYVRYINEKDPITYVTTEGTTENVTLKLVFYDTGYEPGNAPLGFRYLTSRGAVVVVSEFTQDAEMVKSVLSREKVPMLSATTTDVMMEPPTWIFAHSPRYEDMVAVTLQWISEQWDYAEKGRRPKIGAVGWMHAMGKAFADGAEAYSKANPELFEWDEAVLAPVQTFSWDREAKKLRDCDYIVSGLPAVGFVPFVKAIKGYDSKMVFFQPVAAEWGFVKDAVGIDDLDGFILADYSAVWEDEDDMPIITTIRENLREYRPGEEQKWIDHGNGWITGYFLWYFLGEVLRKTVDDVGAENVDGEAIYSSSQNVTVNIPGYATLQLTETRRQAMVDMRIYEFDKDAGFVRQTDWTTVPAFD